MDNIEENILNFIRDELGKNEKVSLSSSLQDDLNIYGDDAVDLLISFSKKFYVKVDEFNAADFFRGEGYDIFSLFKKKTYKPLMVNDLVNAVKLGELHEKNININNT